MKTAQTLQFFPRAARAVRRAIRPAIACAAAAACLFSSACAPRPELVPPEVIISPYGVTSPEPLAAVAPLNNESGTSTVDALAVTDAVIARTGEVRGLACLPLNRVLGVMRTLKMPAVRSPADARKLADALGVDVLIVGSITAYDPYDPPTLGLTLGLYPRPRGPGDGLDPNALSASARESPRPAFSDEPASVVSEHLDAKNHEVLMNLRRYAQGRHDDRAALGWRAYTASMGLYTEFAAWWTVYRLLQQERLRLGRADAAPAPAQDSPEPAPDAP